MHLCIQSPATCLAVALCILLVRSNCQDAATEALSWIPCKTDRCPSLTGVRPKELQRTTVRTLQLTIDNLPPLTDQFLCVFTIFDKVLITNATRNNIGLDCPTPRADLLPSIPAGQDHFTAKLSVKTNSNPEFVATNFTFFDCSKYTSCTPCVSSNFPCDWCVDGHRCTHDTAENCRNDILVTGANREGPSYRQGPTFCPAMNATADGSSEILVPAGTKKGIRVRVRIIGQFIVQTRFLCQFNIEGRVTSVVADLIADTIYCEPMEFSYTQRGPNTTATFAVVWGGSKPLDNLANIHVLIYRCRDMSENCGMCLALDQKFGCGWCQSTNRCEVSSQCDDGWLHRNQTCSNPSIPSLTSIKPGQDHFTAKLSVKTNGNPEFVATNFTFFDCSTYTSCTHCVSSNFPCDWCVDGHRCTNDTAKNCRNDILVTGANREGPSYRRGPTFCPAINATADGSPEILVSAGTKKGIRVRVRIIGQFIVQTRFLCQFNIEGRVTSVVADLIADTIYCEPMEFSYTQRGPNTTATFAVVWGGSKPLDNLADIHVLIYRCRDMSENCGMCLALDQKFGCGWCQSTNRCEVSSQCSDGWLDQNQTCPNPSILSFRPESGPWEGGTNITIEGINLGRTFRDIYGGVAVAGVPCKPYEHLYKATEKIVCVVEGPGVAELRTGPVTVKVANFRGESKQHYQFVDPKIERIYPRRGPKSGGTLLSVKGAHMNAGSQIEVFVDKLPCKVVTIDALEIRCLTSASHRQQMGKIKVKFDHGIRLHELDLFEYTEDPIIERLESGLTSKLPKGIPAGGVKISVSGQHLLSIQKPMLYVYNEEKTQRYFSSCEVLSDSLMTCSSPYIPDINTSMLEAEKPKQLDYGFEMDNVAAVQNISINSKYPKFSLYPNPQFDVFDDTIERSKSDYLTIKGVNIDRACQESDITVRIGNSLCNVTSLSKQELTCKLPSTTGSKSDNGNQGLPEVVVLIGQNFRVNIGKLSYATTPE